jgi:biopolymer transport protein TolR
MHPRRQNRGRLVHKAPPKLDSVRNEINVTPLVDVCLVLLIIFMVILPMLARGKEVNLPKTLNHSKDKDTRQPIVALAFDITKQEWKYYVDKEEIKGPEAAAIPAIKSRVQDAWKALEASNAALGEKADRRGEKRVLLKADHTATYKQVYPLIIAMHEIEAVGIDLGTNEADEGKQ